MTQSIVAKDKIKGFYDQRYEGSYMKDNDAIEVFRVESVLRRVPGGIKRILDYGCGQGRWLPVLAGVFPDARIAGIDISAKALEKAQLRFPGYDLQAFDGVQSSLQADSFDLIFSYHVLEHVADVGRTVADMSRLLSEGGHIVVIFPCRNTGSFEEKIARIAGNGIEKMESDEVRFFFEDAGHLRRMTSREIIEKFNHHGLCVAGQFFANQFWGAVNWISKSGTDFPVQLFNFRNGNTIFARVKLFSLRIIFLLLAMIRFVACLDFFWSFRNSRSLLKKIGILMGMPCKALAWPIDRMLDFLALAEWKICRKRQNGSAQFLIFRKGN